MKELQKGWRNVRELKFGDNDNGISDIAFENDKIIVSTYNTVNSNLGGLYFFKRKFYFFNTLILSTI